MDLESIMKLIQSVSDSSLSSFTLEEGTLCLSLTKGIEAGPAAERRTAGGAAPGKSGEAVPGISGETAPGMSGEITRTITDTVPAAEEIPEGKVITSPLVGTFYAASAPDADPYAVLGDTVKKGQILGIVEAMKLMNEIESDFDGAVKAIYVEDGQMVEYGQPMFLIG